MSSPKAEQAKPAQTTDVFLITGPGGETIRIPAGEFYFNTKARARRMCLNHLSGEARQVYAALELGTMGFRQEMAIVRVKGGIRPMTSGDISEMTGLDQAHVRRGLRELERAGLVERRNADESSGPLQKGNIVIYSWAVPRTVQEEGPRPRAASKPTWFPESWEALTNFIKRNRIKGLENFSLPEDEAARDLLLEAGERAARALEEADAQARAYCETVRAQSPLNKEERTERTDLRESSVLPIETEMQEAPPPPSPPASPAVTKAAETLVHILATEHRRLEPPGNIPRACRAVAAILTGAPDIEIACLQIRASHQAFMAWWPEQRRQGRQFVPQLWRWFEDGDYLHPPGDEALQHATNGKASKNEPDWLDRERRTANGETV